MTNTMRIHLLEARYELIKTIRMPAYTLPTVLFPLVFYLFFGVAMGKQQVHGTTMAAYLIATYGAFGVIGASLFGFGVTVATERGQGWMQVKRTTPMPLSAYFFSKIAMSMIFSLVVVAILVTAALTAGRVRLEPLQIASLVATLVAGSVPFCAIGLAIGYFAGPNSAPAIVNLVYLPASFLSGLWLPYDFLPRAIRSTAHYLPPFHLGQLALEQIGAPHRGSAASHAVALAGFTLIGLAIAVAGHVRDEGKTYG